MYLCAESYAILESHLFAILREQVQCNSNHGDNVGRHGRATLTLALLIASYCKLYLPIQSRVI